MFSTSDDYVCGNVMKKEMKFIVAVDLEGVACAYAPLGASVEDSFNVQFVRKQATKEADAAVRALFDMGATEVVVWDNHGRGCSLDCDLLDERCYIAIDISIVFYIVMKGFGDDKYKQKNRSIYRYVFCCVCMGNSTYTYGAS